MAESNPQEDETPPAKPRRLPLAPWHRDVGADFRVVRGVSVPWTYRDQGDAAQAGLLDLADHDRLELLGEDRQRFLGGLVTCAVADLEPGSGSYGFVTSLKGRCLADVAVAAFDDRLFLLLPPGRGPVVAEHLAKYVVADRVEVLPLEELVPVALVGGDCRQRLVEAGAWPEKPWRCALVELAGSQVPVSRHERLGVPALVAWVSSSIVRSVVEDLVGELGLAPVGRRTVDDLRVQHGLPWFGIDWNERNLPQETGIDAVDYTKGCYLGQEVVARLHYRGQAPRLMRRLRLEEGLQPGLPATVELDGRAAGTLTTQGSQEGPVPSLGLAMVQRRAADPGTELQVGEGTATVEELPASTVEGTD